MTDRVEQIQEIFAKRIVLVAEISRLNAEQLQNTQKLSGNQIDLLRCTDALNTEADNDQLRGELAQAESRDALLRTRICDCDDSIRALEEQVAELDRKLEAI